MWQVSAGQQRKGTLFELQNSNFSFACLWSLSFLDIIIIYSINN
jgi:hypothetical protein